MMRKPPLIYVDDGIPEDWGPPDEANEERLETGFLGRNPVSSRRWRTLILDVTADERRALVALAEVQRRSPEETAAWLLRVALEDKGLLESGALC